MEEKEAVVTILLDTRASMDYGKNKKSELACKLAAALGYLGLNNMDRVLLYDMQRMQIIQNKESDEELLLQFEENAL